MSNKKHRNLNLNSGRNKAGQILLSISILVSGREETTEKCIASLDRLRRRVPCELILTDTGCSTQMHEWLKQRADKLLTFTWCNDFAAARNVGLQVASGKWFMFMDDDEWFEDTTQIEDFFLSGEYRRYQSASYVVRNYAEMDGSVWRDTPLNRMTRIRQETRFFYPIHESLWPLLEPIKRIGDYAHHYGYASSDPEVQRAKRQRNLQLLLPEIERDSHCMKHYLQAVSEYFSMDEYAAAWEMAEKGIDNYDSARGDNVPHIYGLYAATVRMRLRAKRSVDTVHMGTKHLEHAALSDLAKASISGDLAIAYGELAEYRECLRYLQDYLRWKDYFTDYREKWLEQVTLILDSCFENFQYRKAMGWGFAAALALGDSQSAEKLLARDTLEWWLDAVRGWYTLADEQSRQNWQGDFQRLVTQLELTEQTAAQRLQAECWEEDGAPYVHLRQLYGILTAPEPQPAQGESAEEAQMEILAEQLKEKIRLLMQQGQQQAALAVIKQLRGFFPTDMELLELQERCEENAE